MPERPRVGLLVPNLFLRIPVEAAVRGAGAEPVAVPAPVAVERSGCRVIIADLDALRPDPAPTVGAWVRGGLVVLGFGAHVEAALLSAARRAGAVVLPRSAFLGRLPELLAAAMASAGVAPEATDSGGGHDRESND
jgi:hypothetical protein